MIGQANIPAATLVLGYDAFQNETWQTSGRNRIITGITIVGSTASNDFGCDLFVEDTKIASLINSTGGVVGPQQEDFVHLGAKFVPAGSKISCIVTNAPVANPVIFQVQGRKL